MRLFHWLLNIITDDGKKNQFQNYGITAISVTPKFVKLISVTISKKLTKVKIIPYTDNQELTRMWVEYVIVYNIYRMIYGGIPVYWNTIDGELNCTKCIFTTIRHIFWCNIYRYCLCNIKTSYILMLIENISNFCVSDTTQEGQQCFWCTQLFPKILDDYPIRKVCHLWWM